MAFNIRMGLPEMAALWNDLSTRKQQGRLDKDEEKFFKKLVKTLGCLGQNPRHNSVASHEIDDLTRKYGLKIFQSYLENNTPSAGRIRGTSRCWPSSRTRRTQNAVLASGSSCHLYRRQRQSRRKSERAIKNKSGPQFI
jgi:hypothetical protein